MDKSEHVEYATLDETYSLDGCEPQTKWPISEIAVEIEVIFDMLVEDPTRFAGGAFSDDSLTRPEALQKLYMYAMDDMSDAYCLSKVGSGDAIEFARRAVATMFVFCWFIDNFETHQARLRDWDFGDEQ